MEQNTLAKKRYDELMGLMNILLNDPILETYEKYKGLDGVFNHIMENVNDSINDILNYYLSMKKDFKDGNVVKALRKIRDENIYNTLEKYNGSDDVKTVIDIIYNSLDVKTEHVDKIVKIIGNIKDDGNKKNVFKIISLYVSKTETIENSETDEYEKVGSIDDYFEKELGNALTRIDSLREKGKLELLECVIPYVNRYVISGGLLNVLDVYADNPGVIDMLVDLPNKGEFKMGRLGGAVDQAAVRGTYDFFTNYLIKEYLIKNKLDEEQLGWICRAAYVATKEEKSSDDEQINNCEYYVANLLSPIIEERIKIKKDISTKYDSMKEQEIQKIKN